MSEFGDKVRTINFGTPRKPAQRVVEGAKRVEVIHEDTGQTSGWHTHHGSGRVDATVTAGTMNVDPAIIEKARTASGH